VSKFVQSVLSQRFLEVLDELLDKRIISSDAAFCAKAEYAPQSLSQIRKGNRDVTLDLVGKLFTLFGGSPLYIFSGNGDRIFPMEVVAGVQEPTLNYRSNDSSDKELIKALERLVQAKDENNQDLRRNVKQLEAYIELLKVKSGD
jgi:hypothetical protein